MDLIQENIRSVFIQNLNWFMLCLPADYLVYLDDLEEESIISQEERQTILMVTAPIPPLTSVKISQFYRFSFILRDNNNFVTFFQFLKSKVDTDINIKNYLNYISTEFSNRPILYHLRFSF